MLHDTNQLADVWRLLLIGKCRLKKRSNDAVGWGCLVGVCHSGAPSSHSDLSKLHVIDSCKARMVQNFT
jgi:hypothetical protein